MVQVVPRSAKSLLWQARIGLGLGLLGIGLAVFFALQASDLRASEVERAAVSEAGELIALRVTTFEGVTIDEWVADVQTLTTGTYADEVAQRFDTEIRQTLREREVNSVGEITSSFVQDIDGDDASVFAVVRQRFTNNVTPSEVSDELRMEIDLTLVDGEWLAEDVAVLGPSQIDSVVEPGTGTAPQPAPSLDPSSGGGQDSDQ